MDNNNMQMTEQAEKTKKNVNPKKKKIVIAAIIVGVIALIAILIGVNHTLIMSDFNYAMMPKSITADVDGRNITFYKYKNKEFNQFKDKETPLKAFGFYYLDDNGKKVDLSWDKSFTGSKGTTFTPNIWFMFKANDKLEKVKSVSSKVIPIVVIVLVVLIIYLWFKNWCKREDKRMEALYGKKEDRHNNQKKKKN